MIDQTSLSDNDPLCPFAGIISGISIYFVITFQSYVIFDLYTVWYQNTAECYTVSIECWQSKTLLGNLSFSWMLYHSETQFVMH